MQEAVSTANLLAARIFYDFCRDADWVGRIRERLQAKLSTVRVRSFVACSETKKVYIQLPHYIDQLRITRLEPGRTTPRIRAVQQPYIDDFGLWFDLDMLYEV